MSIVLYLVLIIAANIVTGAFQPFHMGPYLVPWGTVLIGLILLVRDRVQYMYGKKIAYLSIIVALILSAVTSFQLGSSLAIVAASSVSFLLSEVSETEIFSFVRSSMAKRVLYAGLVGGVLDSAIFVILGLSPIGANMLPWVAVPDAIIGQVIVKCVMQAIGALIVSLRRR